MKKLLFICLVSLCATLQTNAQMRDTTLNTNTHGVDASSLFQKSKKQKTTAWILLGGGAAAAITGVAIGLNDLFTNKGEGVFYAGIAMMAASVPFFILSARKANIMLKDETVFFNPQLNIKEHLVSLGIKINL